MAENNETAEAPAPKSKLKLIIMLVVVVILAIALSVAGTLWFLGDTGQESADDEGETAETADEAFVTSSYHLIDKALVTTVQAEGRQRYAQVHLALESTDPQALEAAKLHMPLIRSQLVRVLGSSDFADLQTPEGRVALADRMLETVNQALEQESEPAIKRVLLRNFVVQ